MLLRNPSPHYWTPPHNTQRHSRIEKTFYKDTTPFFEARMQREQDNFEPERFMKDPEDIEKCEALFKNNFSYLQVFYLKWLAQSKRFPEIDQKMVLSFVQHIIDEYEHNTGEKL